MQGLERHARMLELPAGELVIVLLRAAYTADASTEEAQ